MLNKLIVINGCNHYFANELGGLRIFFMDSAYFVEEDMETHHPLGQVYKPKGIIDGHLRFVIQPDRSILVFKLREWKDKANPYYNPPSDNFSDDVVQMYNQLKKLKYRLISIFKDGKKDSKFFRRTDISRWGVFHNPKRKVSIGLNP